MTDPTPQTTPTRDEAVREPQFHCVVCNAETPIANITGPTWCEECCPDHDYEYERGDRTHYCKNCGAEPPYDWHGYDPIDY